MRRITLIALTLPMSALAQQAGDLQELAQQQGYKELAKLIDQSVSDLGFKNGARMLELSGLKHVRFPVELRGSLQGQVQELSDLSQFTLTEAGLNGVLRGRPSLPASAAACVNDKGKLTKAPLTVTPAEDHLVIGGVDGCWKADGVRVLLYAQGEDPKALLKGEPGLQGLGPLKAEGE